ncbi:MAG: hypothetical protein FWD78_15090 [Treponema sp.]|nr:hypothetical protein [Treponema sp.]
MKGKSFLKKTNILIKLSIILGIMIFPGLALPLAAQTSNNLAGESLPVRDNPFTHGSLFFQGSILFFLEDNGNLSDPMPILPGPGVGYGISPFANESIRLEATLDMYFTTYGYKLGRPVPAAWENRSAFVWGNVLAIQAGYFFEITRGMTIRVYGGPAADLRAVLIAPDLNEAVDPMDEIRSETSAVFNYFWSAGRWFLPVMGAGMDFNLNEKFKLGFDMRVWFPVYKLWTNENLPPAEGWRFGIGVRVTVL